jgi:hypothetical protein
MNMAERVARAGTLEEQDIDRSILPVAYLGVVAPMNALGFALSPFLGLLYEEALVLIPANSLVFSFQQQRAADEARRLPYDAAVTRDGVRVYRLDELEHCELVHHVTGLRLLVTVRGRKQRWILQHADAREVAWVFNVVLGERFVST